MKAIILRFDAPMMSFGGVIIDQNGFIERFPGSSMLTGLLGNALGWRHEDFEKLSNLQQRIKYAARWDVTPDRLVDYHTVDLGQAKMCNPGWTTRGEPEHRGKGAATKKIHPRYRHYWIDGLMTVALTLEEERVPTLQNLQESLMRPARPIFIGRKCCLPTRPLLDPDTPLAEGNDLIDILRSVPVWTRNGSIKEGQKLEACWPPEIEGGEQFEIRRVYDQKNWADQLPAGSRLRAEGFLPMEVKT